MAVQDAVVLDYIQKLTGLKNDELAEASEDRQTWRRLVVVCVDPQPPYERERERERARINTNANHANLCLQ